MTMPPCAMEEKQKSLPSLILPKALAKKLTNTVAVTSNTLL
jgi:hypothetical protein